MSRGTRPRSLRIPPKLWEAAVEQAKRQDTTVTAVVVEALRKFTRETPR